MHPSILAEIEQLPPWGPRCWASPWGARALGRQPSPKPGSSCRSSVGRDYANRQQAWLTIGRLHNQHEGPNRRQMLTFGCAFVPSLA